MKGDKIKYWDGYKYQLAETYACQTKIYPPQNIYHSFFSISTSGVVTAKEGYAWDGASGPTFDTKDSMRGSLIHDIFYQAMGMGLLSWDFKPQADKELETICIEDGMWPIRARLWERAVRRFGGWFSRHFPQHVKIAP